MSLVQILKLIRLIAALGAIFCFMLAATAHLWAQQQQVSPSQLAISIDTAINQMAQTIERQEQEIAQLKKQLAEKAKDDPHAQH